MERSLYTLVAHDQHDERHQGAVTFPIYQNTLFTQGDSQSPDSGFYYSRDNNPTVMELEKRLALLEGGEEARCFASGMAAITTAIQAVTAAGQHVVCVHQAYGGTTGFLTQMMNRFGVETTLVNGTSLDEIEAAIRPETTLLYLETPTSLYFELQDLAACAAIAKRHKLLTICDNSYATACFQSPLSFGIDLVVHSLTKYVGGHSDALGGAIIGSKALMDNIGKFERTLLGGVMTAQTASLMMRGLRTLPLRMEHSDRSGLSVATYLDQLPFLLRVRYPGLTSHPQYELAKRQMRGTGGLLSFEWQASADMIARWKDKLTYFRTGCSWGGYESLVILLGNGGVEGGPTLIRLYIGLEDVDALIGDLQQAFQAVVETEQLVENIQ